MLSRLPAAPLRHHVGDVFGLRAEEQMGGTHASGIVAAMQDVQTLRNRPSRQFPGDTMGRPHAPDASPHTDSSIAMPMQNGAPVPASRTMLLDLLPEPIGQGSHASFDRACQGTVLGGAVAIGQVEHAPTVGARECLVLAHGEILAVASAKLRLVALADAAFDEAAAALAADEVVGPSLTDRMAGDGTVGRRCESLAPEVTPRADRTAILEWHNPVSVAQTLAKLQGGIRTWH